MSCARERRCARLLASGVVMAAMLSLSGLVGLVAPSYGDDDYPYRGLGHCPLVPLPKPPKPPPGTRPGGTAHPHGPSGNRPHGPGAPGHPGPNTPPAPPAPPPPRECARHIWFYNGSYGDAWGFAMRNCTSFAAWRLRETNGVTEFANHMAGGTWGDAGHWDNNARDLGYLVDHVPAVGAVAQTDAGRIGHVAWVSAVADGTVTVEEYNYYTPGGYDVRTVPTSAFRYLHIDDLAPPPYLGSTRTAATAVDVRGLTWTARVSPRGSLMVRRPSGHPAKLGSAGAWSPSAAPSIVADDSGRVWLAGVTRTGRVLLAHTSTSARRWSRLRSLGHGDWSAASTPTLAVDGSGRVHLFALTAEGAMVERHLLRRGGDRWSRPHRLGAPGSWSPQAAPAVSTDRRGRTWVVAVTRHGSLQSQHSNSQGNRWSGFRPVDGRTWSVTSTPALTSAADGRLLLASVTSRGELVARRTAAGSTRWHHATALPGLWSPYASPTMAADDSGRMWLAAVDTGGTVVVRGETAPATAPAGWGRAHRISSSASVTDAPALVGLPSGGLRVDAVRANGSLVSRRIATSPKGLPGSRRGGLAGRPRVGL